MDHLHHPAVQAIAGITRVSAKVESVDSKCTKCQGRIAHQQRQDATVRAAIAQATR